MLGASLLFPQQFLSCNTQLASAEGTCEEMLQAEKKEVPCYEFLAAGHAQAPVMGDSTPSAPPEGISAQTGIWGPQWLLCPPAFCEDIFPISVHAGHEKLSMQS